MRRFGIPGLAICLVACYGTIPSPKIKDRDSRGALPGDPSADGGPPGTVQEPPKTVVADCGSLPAAGTWDSILPPGVTKNFAFAVDPVNLGTVYLGTDSQQVWKSTDCAATWKHINTGKNGNLVGAGMNWTLIVDPINPEIVYTNSGYGKETSGAFRSKNGGVDWDQIWPPPDGKYADVVDYDFANTFALDPNNHKHLLLTFHAICNPPFAESCVGETFDGGDTWRLANGDEKMVGTEGQVIYFLDTPGTWLWASQTSGFWRTENSGATWTHILPEMNEAHPQGSQLIRAKDGTFYVATKDGVWRSKDGKSWTLIDGTGPLAGGLVSDGTTMYMSNSFYWNSGTDLRPYFTAPESTGTPWKQMEGTPGLTAGGCLGLDPSHRLLYSSNLDAGFWRAVLP